MATDAHRAAIERELAMLLESAGGRREPRLGCTCVSHKRLGYCSACTPDLGKSAVGTVVPLELLGWRLLAMREDAR